MGYEIENGIPIFYLTAPKEERWKAHIVDLSKPVASPEPLLVQSTTQTPLLYRRGIHISSGKQKAGKTFYNSILVSALLNESGFFNLVPTRNNFKVLFADTEQDMSDTQEVIRRIHRINNWPLDKNVSTLTGSNLRELSAAERIQIIEESVEAIRPDVLFIDGIVDLCLDFNDLAEGHAVTTMLMKWAVKYDMAIVTALHVNKGDDNLRGHLGTFLSQKGENVIRITKEDDGNPYMSCKVADSRHAPIDEFYFRIEEGIPVVYQPLGVEVKQPVFSVDYDSLFSAILGNDKMNKKELSVKVSLHTGKSIDMAKKYIEDAKNAGIIRVNNGMYEHKNALPF